ncbi:MAG: hypothetical protein JSV38_10385 [Desulfobacterales bacterium]|nr:MAG: hypothetical protein JSV38_10385 [Desulfobacterales bacterium]
MIGKNISTVLIVVVVLGVAFFGYQYFKKSKDLEAHHEDTYARLTEASKKSPRAGLAQMGRAINQYYAANKSYPTNLNQLYPKYMTSQPFINDINWTYRPTGDNFRLSKSVTLKNRTVVASIDKGLRVRIGASTTVALAAIKPTAAPRTAKPGRSTAPKTVTASEPSTEDIPAIADPPLPVAQPVKAPDKKIKEPEAIAPPTSGMQTIVIDKSETPSGFVSELSNAYLVWKDEQGQLGFGNVQYPRIDGLSIATPYNWFNVIRPLDEEASDTQEIMTSEGAGIDIEAVASYFSNQYLVWKDKNGFIGFGNTQYPSTRNIEYVNIGGEWLKFNR